MRMLLINILIFIVATLLLISLGSIGLIYGLVTHIRTFTFVSYLGKIMYSINVGIDQIGNVLLGVFLNHTCLEDRDVDKQFGRVDETISHVLAHNQDNATRFGNWLINLLEWLDPGHMDKSL
jgi:hypothetical protein